MTQIILPATNTDAVAESENAPRFDAGPLWILLLALLGTVAGWMPGRTLLPSPSTTDSVISGRLNQVAPSTIFAGDCLRQGRMPLWNPKQEFGGGPVLGNGEVGALYPTVLLHTFLPAKIAWAVSGVVLYWVAGFGAWWLAKKLGMHPPARLAAGTAYMFSGAMVMWLNQPIAQTMALLPMVIAASLSLAARPSWWRLAVLALLISVSQLGGRPDVSAGFLIASMLAWVCLMIGHLPTAAEHRQGGLLFWGGGLLAMVVAMGLGVMVAGVQWVTWVEYVIDWTPQAFRSVFEPERRDVARTAILFGLPSFVAIVMALLGIGRGLRLGAVGWVILAGVAIALAFRGDAERMMARRWPLNWTFVPAMLGAAALAVAMLAAIGAGALRLNASRIWIALIAVNGLAFTVWCNTGSSAGKSVTSIPGNEDVSEYRHHGLEARATKYSEPDALPPVGKREVTATAALIPPRISLLQTTLKVYPSTRPALVAGSEPRVWIARPGTQAASGTAALLATTRPSLDPQATAITDPELAPEYASVKNPEDARFCSPQRSPAYLTGRPAIAWVEDSPDRIRLRITGGSGGWLVLAEPIAPGWKARFVWNVTSSSGGKKKEHDIEKDALIFPAFGWMRGIPLPGAAAAPPPGRSFRGFGNFRELGPLEVHIEYRPRGFKHGCLVSLAGGLVVLMLLAGGLIDERLHPAGKRQENLDAGRT